MTPTLKKRVEDKIGKVVTKLGHDVNSCHVKLRVHKFPADENHTHLVKKDSMISEVTLNMVGGAVLRASERTDDMYASIDLMAHRLAQKLKKHNEKAADFKIPASVVEEYKEPAVKEVFDEESLLLELDKKYKDQAKVNLIHIFSK